MIQTPIYDTKPQNKALSWPVNSLIYKEKLAPPAGIEPATFRLGDAPSSNTFSVHNQRLALSKMYRKMVEALLVSH
jgi:hypothetical protein